MIFEAKFKIGLLRCAIVKHWSFLLSVVNHKILFAEMTLDINTSLEEGGVPVTQAFLCPQSLFH